MEVHYSMTRFYKYEGLSVLKLKYNLVSKQCRQIHGGVSVTSEGVVLHVRQLLLRIHNVEKNMSYHLI
jgi:hypothetical protein